VKDRIFRTFHFCEFQNGLVIKVQKFFGNIRFFQTRKKISKIVPPVFGSKNPVLRQKQGFWGQKQGFPNIQNLWNIRNWFYSKLSKNYEKMTLKLNFKNCEKLVPTRTFEFKFGMQGLNQKMFCKILNIRFHVSHQ